MAGSHTWSDLAPLGTGSAVGSGITFSLDLQVMQVGSVTVAGSESAGAWVCAPLGACQLQALAMNDSP